MENIRVDLKNYTPLKIFIDSIRTCWDSHKKCDSSENSIGKNDAELIDRIVNKHKHHSTMEHIFYNFEINGISRLCLQELARHRMASFSVKSTRYTLKELKDCAPFVTGGKGSEFAWSSNLIVTTTYNFSSAIKFIVLTGDKEVDCTSIENLENLRKMVALNKSNDIVKYCLPECYRTSLRFSINARSLRNFLELRSSNSAHFEIRHLAKLIYNSLPSEHKEHLYKNIFKED